MGADQGEWDGGRQQFGRGRGTRQAGTEDGTEVATETSAGVGVWGACGPRRGPPWLCQTPSIPARASVLRQQQEISGVSEMVTHGEFHEGTSENVGRGWETAEPGSQRG